MTAHTARPDHRRRLRAQRLRDSRGRVADDDEWGDGASYQAMKPCLQGRRGEVRARPLMAEELSPWHHAFPEAAGDAAFCTRSTLSAASD
jgi:hypothetical protein